MDTLIKYFLDLATHGGIIGILFTVLGTVFLVTWVGIKIYMFIKDLVASHNVDKLTKTDIKNLQDHIDAETQRLSDAVSDLDGELTTLKSTGDAIIRYETKISDDLARMMKVLDDIVDGHAEDVKSFISLQKDIGLLTNDFKTHQVEISRQFQEIQKDIASLNGTLIGMTTNRQRLK